MAGTKTTPLPVETDAGFQSIGVEEIPTSIAKDARAAEAGLAPPSECPRRDIKRPSLVGNLVFLAFVGVLGLWGMFLLLYLLKNYLGIDIFPSISMSRELGL